jgi:transcriptional regulator
MLYVPKAFAVEDVPALHAFIAAHSFATLISPHAEDPAVTHVPLLLEPSGPLGTLTGHFARANPHWQRLEGGEALAIFHGPHAYVSPSWYATHPSVPTWNFAAVHARGRARLVHDASALHEIVRRLVDHYEGGRDRPWRMHLPEDYQNQMLQGIVGFHIEITTLTGKFKLSQNRPRADRARVIEALGAGDAGAQAVAGLMRETAAGDL